MNRDLNLGLDIVDGVVALYFVLPVRIFTKIWIFSLYPFSSLLFFGSSAIRVFQGYRWSSLLLRQLGPVVPNGFEAMRRLWLFLFFGRRDRGGRERAGGAGLRR